MEFGSIVIPLTSCMTASFLCESHALQPPDHQPEIQYQVVPKPHISILTLLCSFCLPQNLGNFTSHIPLHSCYCGLQNHLLKERKNQLGPNESLSSVRKTASFSDNREERLAARTTCSLFSIIFKKCLVP